MYESHYHDYHTEYCSALYCLYRVIIVVHKVDYRVTQVNIADLPHHQSLIERNASDYIYR